MDGTDSSPIFDLPTQVLNVGTQQRHEHQLAANEPLHCLQKCCLPLRNVRLGLTNSDWLLICCVYMVVCLFFSLLPFLVPWASAPNLQAYDAYVLQLSIIRASNYALFCSYPFALSMLLS